ncbi:MAG: hypothetical protein V3U10_04870 [Bacteroidota bacterium]
MAGGTHQMMFVVAAMTLLSQITIIVSQFMGSTIETNLQSEATITATGLAQSLLREVTMKGFDENTLTDPADMTSDLTLDVNFGPDAGEAYPNFDDIDDYDEYARIVTTARLGDYRVRTEVWYVRDNNLNEEAPLRTFYKKVIVTVDQNTNIAYPVTLSKIISY